jgi:hypothetical protein
MKKLIYAFLLIFFLVIVAYIMFNEFVLKQPKFDKALMHYDSPGIQKNIIAKLEKLDIPYSIDKQGYILYKSDYELEIKKISEEIKREHSSDVLSISISNNEHKDYFIELLKQANIPYNIKKVSDTDNYLIEWDEKYNDEVRKLKINFLKTISGTQKPPNIAFSSESEKEVLLTLLNEKNIPYKLLKSESVKSISTVNEVIEYDWSNYDEVQELRFKARRIMQDRNENRPSVGKK